MDVSCIIVVPCFNEAKRLDTAAFSTFCQRHPGVRFLFVDDGSTDTTAQVITALAQSSPTCTLLRLPKNAGKGEAVRQGMLQAWQENVEYVGYWDADLSTPLDVIWLFLDFLVLYPAKIGVYGSRVTSFGSSIKRHWYRHVGGRVFAKCVQLLFGLSMQDTQCGAKLFRRLPVLQSAFADPFINKWLFDIELLLRLRKNGVRLEEALQEVPVPTWYDVSGSKVQVRDIWLTAKALVAMRMLYR